MRISGTEPSSVITGQTKWFKKMKSDALKVSKQAKGKRDGVIIKPSMCSLRIVKIYWGKNSSSGKCFASNHTQNMDLLLLHRPRLPSVAWNHTQRLYIRFKKVLHHLHYIHIFLKILQTARKIINVYWWNSGVDFSFCLKMWFLNKNSFISQNYWFFYRNNSNWYRK